MPALRITGMLVVACLVSPGLAAANDGAVSLPQTMQAAAIDRAGGPEVITLHTLPVPKPAADEVVIAVDTAGVAIWTPICGATRRASRTPPFRWCSARTAPARSPPWERR